MQYIVLDMEWNQPWPGTFAAKRVLPVKIRGEIIQIGAVRVTDRQIVGDEFQALIKPKFYRKLNKKVVSLTGIKDAMLAKDGIPFPEAMERFRDWCGEDVVFLTWGFDDIGILKENMALHGLDSSWIDRWYNAQMIFNAQTDGATAQKALKTAMQMAGVEASRPAHDALGDAYHTAILCTRLDLVRGMAEYDKALEKHENGFHGAELPGCLERKVFHGLRHQGGRHGRPVRPGKRVPHLRNYHDPGEMDQPAGPAVYGHGPLPRPWPVPGPNPPESGGRRNPRQPPDLCRRLRSGPDLRQSPGEAQGAPPPSPSPALRVQPIGPAHAANTDF